MPEPLRCSEHVWRSALFRSGGSDRCGNRAKYAARRLSGNEYDREWHPICGVRAHVQRWEAWTDADIIELEKGQLPADPEAAAAAWRAEIAALLETP